MERMTRRGLLKAAAAGAVVSTLPGREIGATQAKPVKKHKFRYIDDHLHLGTFYWGKPTTVQGVLQWMDENDIERVTIQPLISPEAAPFVQTNESALQVAKEHPDRFLAFVALDPRGAQTCPTDYQPMPDTRPGHIGGVKAMVEILGRYQQMGAKGFGEHKTGLPFDHPIHMMLFEAIQEFEWPVLFHLDDIRCMDVPGLPHLERAVKAFPKVRFIGHAAGFWASISGDANAKDFQSYPDRKTAPGGALDRLMDKYPNLCGDLGAPCGLNAIERDLDFGREFIIRHADQLLFGTDYLVPGQEIGQFNLYGRLDLPENVQYKIFRGNAIRLMKLGLDS